MKKTILTIGIFFLTQQAYPNEWIAVGAQAKLPHTAQLELKLWRYVKEENKSKFEPKESYRFQYQFLSDTVVLIHALCYPSPQKQDDPNNFRGPTTAELRKSVYQVKDGGTCFFKLKYDLKKASFNSLNVHGDA